MRKIRFNLKKLPESDTRIELIRKFLNENNLEWEEKHSECLTGIEEKETKNTAVNITHFYFKGNPNNKGYISKNGFTLCTGTKIVSTPNTKEPYAKGQILNELKRLKTEGYLDDNFNLKKDAEFSSPTLAGKMISGTSEGNRNNFKTSTGKTLNEFYSKK